MSHGNLQKTDNIMAKRKLKKDRKYHGQIETDKRTNCDIGVNSGAPGGGEYEIYVLLVKVFVFL